MLASNPVLASSLLVPVPGSLCPANVCAAVYQLAKKIASKLSIENGHNFGTQNRNLDSASLSWAGSIHFHSALNPTDGRTGSKRPPLRPCRRHSMTSTVFSFPFRLSVIFPLFFLTSAVALPFSALANERFAL
jgi:hypothetical protein